MQKKIPWEDAPRPPTLSCSYCCTQRGFTLLFPAPTLKNARMAWTAKRSLPHPCLIYTWEWGRWNNDPLYHQIWGWSKHHPYRSNAGLPVVPSVNVIYLQTRESRWSPLWKRWDYSYSQAVPIFLENGVYAYTMGVFNMDVWWAES